MRYLWSGVRLGFFGAVLGLGAGLLAQKSSGPGAGNAPASTPSRSTTSPTNSTETPGRNSSSTTGGDFQRPLFVEGRVVFDDGSAGNPDIRIERVCNGNAFPQAHTDSRGQFSFQFGADHQMDTDASEAWAGGNSGALSGGRLGSTSSLSSPNLLGCEIRASYPGYRSDVFEIPPNRDMEGLHVGTLILHRLGGVQGTTLSVTTALAPKRAVKEYEKGLLSAGKSDWDGAEKHFENATTTYPSYAIAWFALGQVEQHAGRNDAARGAYETAIKLDGHYVSPYNELALLSAQQGKWQDTAEYSRKALDLNPVEFPVAYWYNAVSNYNLQRMAEAEKSALTLEKMDTLHKFPQAESLLGNIFLRKNDPVQASQHLRAYLTFSPNAQDAPSVRRLLDRLDGQHEAALK